MNREDPDQLPSALIGREAPATPQTTLPGKTPLTDDMLREPGVKLVNVWASWCPPCRVEHPMLMELSQEVPVYGVALRDIPDNALGFLATDGDPYAAIGDDPRGRTAIDWGVTAPPETFILDGEGRIVYRFVGPIVGADYEARFRPQLDKALSAEAEAGG
ncbi:MAG: DsbE family thiol:disulfide interchange protein [Paracoccus sp. (in: a-proteobacteria)]|nr:DsbE family thiol:disulfide interchange protein [Paracoccus sp. (in: a-proteobacteria)]